MLRETHVTSFIEPQLLHVEEVKARKSKQHFSLELEIHVLFPTSWGYTLF